MMEQTGSFLIDAAVWSRLFYFSRTARLLRHLREHPNNSLSLQEAASIACMERTSFSRFFRLRIGITFSEFLRAYRVGLAISAMEARDRTLKDIAFAVGFTNMTTFERAFIRATRELPSRYRARLLAGPRIVSALANYPPARSAVVGRSSTSVGQCIDSARSAGIHAVHSPLHRGERAVDEQNGDALAVPLWAPR